MAWQVNKPDANDDLDFSVNDIQGNFAALDTILTPLVPAVTLPTLAAAPAPVLNNFQLYTLVTGGTAQLHVQDGLGNSYPFTDGGFADPGWGILPSGLMFIWQEFTTVNSAGPTTYTLTVPAGAAGFPNAMLSVHPTLTTVATGTDGDSLIAAKPLNTTQFTVTRHTSHHGTQCNFRVLCIGY